MRNECSKATTPVIQGELAAATAKHPCYSFDAHHQFARMHLPVAPSCNISCNYCNRKFDCVNESRPGVTSEILTPLQGQEKFIKVKAEIENLTVVGIAGPGDALANWEAVKESIILIKSTAPETIFCLSTNGLMLPHYAEDIIALGIKHVTVTVNCLDEAIGAKIYRHIHYMGEYYTQEAAAKILIHNQLAGIKALTAAGILVKVNIVMIKGVNDYHIPEVVKKVKSLGAFMTNIMPLIPAAGSAFENLPQTSMKDINEMRNLCQLDIQQMRHCQQCRADAIGLLKEDQSHKYRMKKVEIEKLPSVNAKTYKVAVTSKYKMLVDLHYGHAEEFHIYEIDGVNASFIETRKSKKYCHGPAACDEYDQVKNEVIDTIADCDAVLAMRIGYDAQQHLQEKGIRWIESCNSIEDGLIHVFRELEMKQAV